MISRTKRQTLGEQVSGVSHGAARHHRHDLGELSGTLETLSGNPGARAHVDVQSVYQTRFAYKRVCVDVCVVCACVCVCV